jgi:hypothetical protein
VTIGLKPHPIRHLPLCIDMVLIGWTNAATRAHERVHSRDGKGVLSFGSRLSCLATSCWSTMQGTGLTVLMVSCELQVFKYLERSTLCHTIWHATYRRNLVSTRPWRRRTETARVLVTLIPNEQVPSNTTLLLTFALFKHQSDHQLQVATTLSNNWTILVFEGKFDSKLSGWASVLSCLYEKLITHRYCV